jgi:hypothetical protein
VSATNPIWWLAGYGANPKGSGRAWYMCVGRVGHGSTVMDQRQERQSRPGYMSDGVNLGLLTR